MTYYLWAHLPVGYDKVILYDSIEKAYEAAVALNLLEDDFHWLISLEQLRSEINSNSDQTKTWFISQSCKLQLAIGKGYKLPQNADCSKGYLLMCANDQYDSELVDMPPLLFN